MGGGEPSPQHWVHHPHMPVTYPDIYLQLARERGVEPARVLAEADLPATVFQDPGGRISPHQYFRLIQAVLALTGDDGLGFLIGARMPLTAHGALGYALLCSDTLGDALNVLQRFWYLRGRGIHLGCETRGEWLTLDFRTELDIHEPVRRVLFDAMLSGMCRNVQLMTGDSHPAVECWFDYPEPDYYPRFRAQLPQVRYAMPTTRLRLPAALLAQRLAMANPEALRLAIAQCEHDYARLGGGPDPLLERARALMRLQAGGYPLPEHLADQLHLSPRTLRRKLHAQGSSYQHLREDARRRDALALLDNPELEIRQIAEQLGYASPANFTRAFRHWTGHAPSIYRLRQQRGVNSQFTDGGNEL